MTISRVETQYASLVPDTGGEIPNPGLATSETALVGESGENPTFADEFTKLPEMPALWKDTVEERPAPDDPFRFFDGAWPEESLDQDYDFHGLPSSPTPLEHSSEPRATQRDFWPTQASSAPKYVASPTNSIRSKASSGRSGRLNSIVATAQKAVKAVGACWRCKILRYSVCIKSHLCPHISSFSATRS